MIKREASAGGWPRQAPLEQARARNLRTVVQQRQIETIWRLGPRHVSELIQELDRHHSLGKDLDWRLARYAAADPGILRVVGGDRFAALPLRVVGGLR